MDPLSQAVLGASAPSSFSKGKEVKKAGILGFLAGMSPDLDVLIQSPTDPLLFLEFHRQFTHSLAFVPFGGLICAIVLYYAFAKKRFELSFNRTWLYCTLGYATHALLDACTTYGTQLLWPFSDLRVAWNSISIIDPLYTLPILVLVILSARKATPWFARAAMIWAISYPMIGILQRDRAADVGWQIAADRGHQPVRLEAKPSFANLLVWKIVYETEDQFYVDAVRVGMGKALIFPGAIATKVDLERDFPWLDHQSQQAEDIKRFSWFSNQYIAMDPEVPNKIIDVRYSMIPNEIDALWAIELDPAAASETHVHWRANRDAGNDRVSALWAMLFP